MITVGDEFFEFVEAHRFDDTMNLRLRLAGADLPFPKELALTQIEARRKAASKLAPFFARPRFLVPTLLSAEQATDWRVARHHAAKVSGKRILDLTAGLGIDMMSMALGGATVTAVEIERLKCDILRYNASLLSLPVEVIEGDANEIIKTIPANSFDIIYIDPARRDSSGRRTYAFADCQPDVTTLLPILLTIAPKVIIKASPLLDLSSVIKELRSVTWIEVVSLRGEVKEVLVSVGRDVSHTDPDIVMTAIDPSGEPNTLTVPMSKLGFNGVTYADESDIKVGAYLCEPDAALMKCAPWGELTVRWPELKKVSHDTHLFISPTSPADFAGRVVRISSIPDKRQLKALSGTRINVATRNYPGGTDTLRKRLRLTDGGERFIYGFRSVSGKPVIVCCDPE